jgi:hypothetical protein
MKLLVPIVLLAVFIIITAVSAVLYVILIEWFGYWLASFFFIVWSAYLIGVADLVSKEG